MEHSYTASTARKPVISIEGIRYIQPDRVQDMKIAIIGGVTATLLVAAIAISFHTIRDPEPAPPFFGPTSQEPVSFPSPDGSPGEAAVDPRYARRAAPASGVTTVDGAAQPGERTAAYSILMQADRSIYNTYEDQKLLALAQANDSSAQLALASRILGDDPDNALHWAQRAAASGSSVAASIAAEALAGKGDVAAGYAAMIEFVEAHGTDAYISRYMRNYLLIHARTPDQLREQARLNLAMKRFERPAPPPSPASTDG